MFFCPCRLKAELRTARRPVSNREVGVFGLHGFGGWQQHAGGDGGVRALFNQNERAGKPVGAVAVEYKRSGSFQANHADVVHRQFTRPRFGFERGHVDAAFEAGDDGLNGLRGVFEEKLFTFVQRTLVHPADARMQIGAHPRQIFQAHNHVAAADVNVVLETKGHRLRTKGLFERAVVGPDVLHGGFDADGQHGHGLAFARDAAGDLSAQAAEVVQPGVARIVRAIDPLHRKTQGAQVPVAGNMDGLQMAEQRRPCMPRHFVRRRDDVVAI